MDMPSLDQDPPPPSPAEQESEVRPARIKMRIKGEEDGPVYEGQTIIIPCLNCGRK